MKNLNALLTITLTILLIASVIFAIVVPNPVIIGCTIVNAILFGFALALDFT